MQTGFQLTLDGHISTDAHWKMQNQTALRRPDGATETTKFFTSGGLEIDCVSVAYPESPVVEAWLVVRNVGKTPTELTRVDSLRSILAPGNYQLHWFDSTAGVEFTPVSRPLEGTKVLEVTSGRSSNGMHPWFALTREGWGTLAGAVAWSGNWIVRFTPGASGYELTAGLSDWEFAKTLPAGASMEAPHVITAHVLGDLDDAAVALGRWGKRFLYPANEFLGTLPVVWNHWWPYEDVDINEQVFRANAERSAAMGLQAVVLDAGWFGDPEGSNDDKSGWSENVDWYFKRGDWHRVNTLRFPSGIRALSDHAHSLGLRFGIWCEIEAVGKKAEVSLRHPEYLALNKDEPAGYLCLGNPEATEWAFGVLEALIRDYGADWLKLDFNLNPRAGCNRTDHGHGTGDGLFEHYRGYYALLARVRAKYPQVVLENCSSGGLRIDLGLAGHTHLAFLSDPDPTVHHLQTFWGATQLLHPSVCYHFVWSQNRVSYKSNLDKDPIKPDMPAHQLTYMVRAVMLGALAFSYRLPDLPPWCAKLLEVHVRTYREVTGRFVRDANLHRLTGQALRTGGGDRWNAFLYVMPNQSEAVLFVFRLPGGEETRVLKLKGLDPTARYRLSHPEGGATEERSGAELTVGLTFTGMPEQSSDLLLLTRISSERNQKELR
jgi:alpha-galactosidase